MATYEAILPPDYLHLLNCICIYELQKTYKCYNKGEKWRAAATRLTADAYSQVLDNFWNRPTYKRPYYYIHNVNSINPKVGESYVPTNPYNNNGKGTDFNKANTSYIDSEGKPVSFEQDGNNKTIVEGSGTPKTINIKISNQSQQEFSNVERGAEIRYGNVSQVRLEIRYGTDNTVFQLQNVYVDYIKAPQNIRLTQQQVDKTEDTSQMLEYPDYVCQEIINELVHIIMENISDQRIQTHPVVSQSIANPAQAQTEPAAQQQPT